MEQWEYRTEILFAGIDDNVGAKETLARLYPGWKPPKFAPESLIPKLNEYGRQGWELISIENVYLGNNWDIAHGSLGNTFSWSRTYLVALKRRLVSG